ncbi:unannotated protein [freshwater metagenome]|uniref:Unannotated protein n=1 Tax=freshwater metagenome TaxID=449393 RepID=A0A6J7GEL3_9ZZZZ|nr:DUF2617 family protein [Actinomycetota bacterium]
MRAAIDVPFRDAAASDLAWALEQGGRPPAGLAHVDVVSGPFDLRLHVLGASHAVELVLPDGARVTETVACGIDGGRALEHAPDRVDEHGLRYAFSAHVDAPGTAAVVALADELHRTLAGDPGGIVATFPGAPGAATGLRARPTADGAAWDTWHLYPERGEVVRTRTSVVLAAAVDPSAPDAARDPGATGDADASPDRRRAAADARPAAVAAGVAR